MTTTPPTRFELWHHTRGISFSPTPKTSGSPLQEPLVLDEKAVTATYYAAEHNLAAQQVSYPELPNVESSTPEVRVRENNVSNDSSNGATTGNVDEKTETHREVADLKPPLSILDFEIDEDLFNAAKKAAPGSPESYWSYTQYRGPPEDGKPRKVKVHYCRTKHTAERVLKQYFMDEEVLGFDLEWSPNATRQQDIRKNVSLIQLASASRIALFHVALFTEKGGFVPPSFKKIMEDPGITKVGVAIKGDCTRVRNFMEIDSKGLLELSNLYKLVTFSSSKQYRNIDRRLVPLATQVEQYLRLPLFKGPDVRSSDWTRALSMDQVIYSASDAYAGLHLYATLEHHRKQLDPCPPPPHHAELNLPIRLAEGIEFETNDEVADISEPIAPAAPTLSDDYIASVLESIKIEDLGAPEEKQKKSSSRARAKTPSGSRHPFIEAAEDRATCYKDAHPSTRVIFSQLRAYYLWYNNDLNPKAIARLLRDPPLQQSTVIGYILSAIHHENMPYNEERLRDELAIPLPYNLRARWPLAVAAANT